MTISLMHQIQLAERELTTFDATTDPRFVADAPSGVRELGARLLRSTANVGLRLANRLDPEYTYARAA
ncbi:MAG TPA: hypothetical protein VFW55_03205 [Propionicimonas sp.]|nr:hypothetical protein [Propionicimonas sp.]